MLQGGALEASTCRDGDLRKKCAVADADCGIGRSQRTFGSCNIGPALGKLRWDAGRNGRRRVEHRFDWNGEVTRDLSDEHGDCMLILSTGQADIGCRRLRGFEGGSGFDNGDVVAGTSVEGALG